MFHSKYCLVQYFGSGLKKGVTVIVWDTPSHLYNLGG